MTPLLGLHHVTAITGDASANLAFYTDVLGLRLVKKTVNQDDVSAYHLFYGDESGQPGTEVTFFHWPQADANLAGPGTIERIWLAVPDEETLAWWRERLLVRGVRVAGGPGALPTDGGSGEGGRGCGGGPGRSVSGGNGGGDGGEGVSGGRGGNGGGDGGEPARPWQRDPLGRPALLFEDPEGQRLGLAAVGSEAVARVRPWAGSPVPPERAIRGMCAMALEPLRPRASLLFFQDVLGFRPAGGSTSSDCVVLECGDGGAGAQVYLRSEEVGRAASDGPAGARRRGWPGRGGVHHVAFRVPDDDAHAAWHARLLSAGVQCSPIIDRYYFRSIYFREPGGILCEIATDGPGFATDEPLEALGERLALPPFLEPHRAAIEAGLPPLRARP